MTMVKSTVRSVVSIGYEGRSVDEVIDLLVDRGVHILIDVRLNAISRKAGLSKTRLRANLQAAGIDYVHLRGLGNPKENRSEFRSGSALGRSRYELELLKPSGSEAMADLESLVARRTVGVLCFELDHSECHRSSVISALEDRGLGLELITA